jgi:biotin-dependent carboxylase-like uncharacterized protein
MGQIKIITAGVHTSIQDFGRVGYQALGVPEGGALDRDAMRLGNVLVGNPEEAAVLEICLGGVAIELKTPARLALAGTSKAVLVVQDPSGHGARLEVPSHRSVDLDGGRIVHLGILPDSNTATIAISGGIDLPKLYGSVATSPNAMIGGFEGRLLKDGDCLNLGPYTANEPELTVDVGDFFDPPQHFQHLHVVMGPQDHRFTASALAAFEKESFKVSPALNRMGMRLDGMRLQHIDNADILSDGIVTGSVQVPGDGQPIILLADHQTTGGYTKIATVITADLPALGRLRPGMTVRFKSVTAEEGGRRARRHEDQLLRLLSRLKPAAPLMDTAALYMLGDTT